MSSTSSLSSRLKKLSDPALIESTKAAARKERNATTEVLHHFIEVENRRLYANRHSSLFSWAIEELGYTEGAAQRRIDSSRLLYRHPQVEQQIESGKISLTQLSYARHFFRQEKKHGKRYSVEKEREVLKDIEGKSTRKTLRYLIERSSAPEKLSPKSGTRPAKNGKTELCLILNEETMNDLTRLKELWSHTVPDGDWAEIIARMAKVTLEKIDPMKKAERAVQRRKKQSAQRKVKLDAERVIPAEAQQAAGEKIVHDPTINISAASAVASAEGLTASATSAASTKQIVVASAGSNGDAGGVTSSLPFHFAMEIPEEIDPVTGERQLCLPHLSHTRYIAANVKHAVWIRDGGQCTYVDWEGRRCHSRHQLELEHIIPFALGGGNSINNLRLMCRCHNSLMADRVFGRNLMNNRRKQTDKGRSTIDESSVKPRHITQPR